MTLKTCSGCGMKLTTKNTVTIGRGDEDILFLNCKSCRSTVVLVKAKRVLAAGAILLLSACASTPKAAYIPPVIPLVDVALFESVGGLCMNSPVYTINGTLTHYVRHCFGGGL